MAGPGNKKRSIHGRSKTPMKRQKREKQRQFEYHSDSDSVADDQDFDAVNLLDSDDDIHNARAEDVGAAEDDSLSSSDSEVEAPGPTKAKMSMKLPKKILKEPAEEDEVDDDDDDDDDEEEEEEQDDEVMGLDEFDTDEEVGDDEFDMGEDSKVKKRNDPTAFATSLSKILSTKLSNSKRADPVLARSAEAHQASKAAVDSALDAKAKRHLREQKRKAMEKGRVKDVLVASRSETTGEPDMTTSDILAIESRLRKVAQRGVVKMFNAVRAAQVKSTEAEKTARKDGVIGMASRTEKVNEMTKKGFLDLIASGGGGLKKSGLEEA